MIKKIVLILSVLVLLSVVTVVSLSCFIDPNYFRGLIAETVKHQTGYELTIEGDLRWHIWPRLSILTESVRLADKGAKEPILSADNMRLDVKLLPLFTKKLVINSIFIKSAVVNMTSDSRGQRYRRQKNEQEKSSFVSFGRVNNGDWSYLLKKFEIEGGTFIFQTGDKERLYFRQIHFLAYPNEKNRVVMQLDGNVDRNQRVLHYDINAIADVDDFPNNLRLKIDKFNYMIKGVGLPINGLFGSITAHVDYHKTPFTVEAQDIIMTSADNKIQGKLVYTTGAGKPVLQIQLLSKKFDLAPYFNQVGSKKTVPPSLPPTIVSSSMEKNELSFLNNFNAKIVMKIDRVVRHQLRATDFVFELINNNGVARIKQLSFDLADGHIGMTGVLNGRSPHTAVQFKMQLSNIALNDLLTQLAITDHFNGRVNGKAILTTDTLVNSRRLLHLKGAINLSVQQARLHNVDLQQIINTAAAQFIKETPSSNKQRSDTEFEQLFIKGTIANGRLYLNSLMALSDLITAKGAGEVDLLTKDVDVVLNINLVNGLENKNPVFSVLKKITVPLRVYGDIAQLHYQVDLEKLLQHSLKKQWQEGLNQLRNKYLPPKRSSSI